MKAKQKRLLSMLLTLCMVLTMVPTMTLQAFAAEDGKADAVVFPGNETLDSRYSLLNKSGKSSEGTNGGTIDELDGVDYVAHLDVTTGTLTLWNYNGGTITNGGGGGAKDITVVLKGHNTITNGSLKDDTGGDITITAESAATLTITCTVSTGSITGISTDSSGVNEGPGAITIGGKAKITIDVENTGTGIARGIYAKQGVTINDDAELNITAKSAGATNGDNTYGIYTENKFITINTTGDITVDTSGAGESSYSYALHAGSFQTYLTRVGTMELKWTEGAGQGSAYTGTLTYEPTNFEVDTTVENTETYTWKDGTPELTGTVTISGDPKFGAVLTANESITTSGFSGTAKYQWYHGVDAISGATEKTYTIVQADIGNTIKVEVTADGYTGSIESSATGTVTKATQGAPTGTITGVAPTTKGGTDGKITGVNDTMEYKSGSAPDTSYVSVGSGETTIENLGSNTYNVRYAETPTHLASAKRDVLVPFRQTVTFESNGGSGVASITPIRGEFITEPTPPTKAGYTFMGWYKESGLTTLWNFASDKISSSDVTLYAKWEIDGSAITVPSAPTGVAAVAGDGQATVTFTAPDTDGGAEITGYTVTSSPEGKTAAATASPITVTDLTNDTAYTFTVVATNSKGDSVSSDASAAVTPTAGSGTTLSGSVTISGDPKFGAVLTANESITTSGFSGTAKYQWYHGVDAISGATEKTYTIVQADIGNTIKVEVTADGYTGSIESSATGTVTKATQGAPTGTITGVAPTTKGGTDGKITGVNDTMEYKSGSAPDTSYVSVGSGETTIENLGSNTYNVRYAETPTHLASAKRDVLVPFRQTVTFESNGGSSVASITPIRGEFITAPPPPTKAGYDFSGWYKESDLTTPWNFASDKIGSSDITLYAKWTEGAPDTYTVTFESNGGSAVAAKTGIAKDTTITAPTSPTRTNYTFNGWYSDLGLTTAWNFATPITADITLYAKWTPSGGGGGGGGSSGGSTPAQTAPAANGAVSVNYTAAGGTATLSLPTAKVNEIIDKSKGGEAVIDLSKVSGTAAASLPKAALEAFEDAGLDVTVKLPAGTITLDQDAAASVADQATGNLTIELKQVVASALTDAQKEAIKTGDVVLDINILSGTKKITDFDGTLAVSVPYNGPQPVAAWYLNDKGELEKLDCTFKDGVVTFTTDHLSLYVLSVDTAEPAWANPFADVQANAWYYDAVKYAYVNDLFSGTSATTFEPNTSMTRGMLVTVLGRMSGADVSGYTSSFDDVSDAAYYAKYTEWAKDKGIVLGVGVNQFAPDTIITRQDIAVMLARYADIMGLEAPEVNAGAVFADADSIADYAKDAAAAMQKAEIISGRPGGMFDPKAGATRAEVSTMLHRFMILFFRAEDAVIQP